MGTDLKRRTKLLAPDTIRFCSKLGGGTEYEIIKRQLIRAASSVGANYRAACRARSLREFIAKIGVVVEESDEVHYWLELLEELSGNNNSEVKSLQREASEIVAIMVASINTARRKPHHPPHL